MSPVGQHNQSIPFINPLRGFPQEISSPSPTFNTMQTQSHHQKTVWQKILHSHPSLCCTSPTTRHCCKGFSRILYFGENKVPQCLHTTRRDNQRGLHALLGEVKLNAQAERWEVDAHVWKKHWQLQRPRASKLKSNRGQTFPGLFASCSWVSSLWHDVRILR